MRYPRNYLSNSNFGASSVHKNIVPKGGDYSFKRAAAFSSKYRVDLT